VLTVAAGDGRPLAVARRDAEGGDKLAPASAVLSLSADAVTPVLAGTALPDGATVDLDGDRRAVDTLHSWFDSSRGLTER
jgi:hypothetical protein